MLKLKSKIKNKPKKITSFRLNIRSRHPSHKWLKENMPKFPFRAILRLGSTTSLQDAYPKLDSLKLAKIKEINSVQGIKNSSNKLLMKQCFTRDNIKTADWAVIRNNTWCNYNPNYGENMYDNNYRYYEYDGLLINNCPLKYPIIAKSLYGSKGDGNYKLDTQEQLEQWMVGKNLNNYIFEKFYTYSKEYRIHVSKNGCFYACRKLLKNDTPENETWHRHDENSVWILEENPKFMKPANWDLIVADCVKALQALQLDIAGFDVKVQGSSKESPEWIIIESNSACSHGDVTKIKYKEELIKLLTE